MRTVAALQKEHSTRFCKQCVITHREHATISTRREPNGLEERYFRREMLHAYYHTGMSGVMNHEPVNERLEDVIYNGECSHRGWWCPGVRAARDREPSAFGLIRDGDDSNDGIRDDEMKENQSGDDLQPQPRDST